MSGPLNPEAPRGVGSTARLALWQLGFRPFYLLASAFAALSVALWLAQYAGVLPFAYLPGTAWHGHEMIFGYTLAVIVGFLFTAVRNWTGRPTPSGGLLMALAALWVAGRVLVLSPYGVAAAVVSAAFPAAAAIAIAVPLAQSGNRR
ncbi:MAG: NnrS family protein, partial [Burkholderiales bacterium]|nr:NnrS family protein [Burkholderiales bacterium]